VLVSAEVEEKAPGFTLPTGGRDNKVSLDGYTRDVSVVLEAVLEDLDIAL
jgi:hypothetical protein